MHACSQLAWGKPSKNADVPIKQRGADNQKSPDRSLRDAGSIIPIETYVRPMKEAHRGNDHRRPARSRKDRGEQQCLNSWCHGLSQACPTIENQLSQANLA